jgi:DNA-binding CsgD family transcriptional regulator
MNLLKDIKSPINCPETNSVLVSKLAQVVNACECSKNLMVAIYHIDKRHFIYCNSKFQEILGTNYKNLLLKGWDFWYSLVEPKELAAIKNQLSNFFTPPYIHETFNLKYRISFCCSKHIFANHEIKLHRLGNHFLAINYFFDVTDKEKIEHCIATLSESINSPIIKKSILTISPREKQVLRLIADGFSSKEIANMLYISDHTAVSHRKNLIEKFEVKNTAHLIKKAATIIVL